MAYGFVGSEVVEITPGNSVGVDFTSLDTGAIQAGDVAYVLLVAGLGTSLGLINWVPPGGWVEVGAFLRIPGGANGAVGRVWERPLDGTETTETFTDSGLQGRTFLAVATVYRGLMATGSDHAQQEVPTSPTSSSAPYSVVNPTDVTGTIPAQAHALGTARQLLLHVYLDFQSVAVGGGIVRTSTDASLAERVVYRAASQDVFISWLDETWASAADLPSRSISTHWSSGTGVHSVDMIRIRSTADQEVSPPDESWETLSATAADLDATLWPTRQPVSVGADNESGRETLDGPTAGFPTAKHQHEGADASPGAGRFLRRFLLMGERRD